MATKDVLDMWIMGFFKPSISISKKLVYCITHSRALHRRARRRKHSIDLTPIPEVPAAAHAPPPAAIHVAPERTRGF